MPLRNEVALYLRGLWLLFLGDHSGANYLDLTDRGMMRSFWAFVWCLPAMAISWYWWHLSYLAQGPSGIKTGLPFFARLALIEAICWLMPMLLIGVLLIAFSAREKFPALVTVTNWLSVPFSYAYSILILIALFLPSLQGLTSILWLVLMFALVMSFARIVKFFIRDQALLVTAIIMTLLVPGMVVSEALQRFLGVYPG